MVHQSATNETQFRSYDHGHTEPAISLPPIGVGNRSVSFVFISRALVEEAKISTSRQLAVVRDGCFIF